MPHVRHMVKVSCPQVNPVASAVRHKSACLIEVAEVVSIGKKLIKCASHLFGLIVLDIVTGIKNSDNLSVVEAIQASLQLIWHVAKALMNKPRDMALISGDKKHRKKLVFLAAVLVPASLFLNDHCAHRFVAGVSKPLNQQLGEFKSELFLKPLQELSKRDRESAGLLGILLGFRSSIPTDQEQN